jgi:hypothetical protein
MRIAFIQLGSGHEALASQVARLQSLKPEAYHIEEAVTVAGGKRLTERLETLKAGDELLLTSLQSLGMPLGDMVATLGALLRRDVAIALCRTGGRPFRVRPGETGAALLGLLAETQASPTPAPAKVRSENDRLLSDAEINDIRRLFKAGLTPRRIGLIYRRSPRCIADLLNGRAQDTALDPRDYAMGHGR